MNQGFVNSTLAPAPPSPDQGSDPWGYIMFVLLGLLLVLPCLVYCWKVGGLREQLCLRTADPLARGRNDFADNMERAFGVGAFVGHSGGPHYRLMSHPQLLFVHGQSTQGSQDTQDAVKPIKFSSLSSPVVIKSTPLYEPSAPMASVSLSDIVCEREPTRKIDEA